MKEKSRVLAMLLAAALLEGEALVSRLRRLVAVAQAVIHHLPRLPVDDDVTCVPRLREPFGNNCDVLFFLHICDIFESL